MKTNLLLQRATELKLHGMIAHWDEICEAEWIEPLITWEETERAHRSLERRLTSSHIKRFKSLAQFDWNWPKQIDRAAIEELMRLAFIKESTNLIFCGPNGVGKSMIGKNICHQSIMHGHTALFVTAAEMSSDLTSSDGDNALQRRIKYYVNPEILCIDEVGYLSYTNRFADLLFDIVSQRYQTKPTLITTNKPFAEWGEIFPNASCVVSIIDRLVHNSEIISIDAESYRLKESKEQAVKRQEARKKRVPKSDNKQSEVQNNER